jgi:hypothetical protein
VRSAFQCLFVVALLISTAGCVGEPPDPPPDDTNEGPRFDPFAQPLFEALSPTDTGIDHVGEWAVGVGVADVDGDGLPDLFLTDWHESRLFRNLGDFQFEEQDNSAWSVEPPAGGGPEEDFGGSVWGVAFADYDNDGDPDMFLLMSGANRVFRNDGDFVFTDVTEAVGLPGTEMTYAMAFQDYDRDGWLDIYVVNHLDIQITASGPGVPPEVEVVPANDYLLRSRGDGTFEDTTAQLPPGALDGTGWMAVWSDLDLDGDRDLYLASELRLTGELQPNHLFRNDGPDQPAQFVLADDGCFCDLTLAPMGVALGDYNRDGLADLFMTNTFIPGSTDTQGRGEVLLRNEGGLVFTDVGAATGANLANQEAGRRTISWGTDFFDADNDGWLDLAIGYGPFLEDPDSAQPNALLMNDRGVFSVHEDSGTSVPDDTRGLVTADFDGDGCLDLVEAHTVTQPGVFRNRCESGHHWLQLDLVGTDSPRDAFGARVLVRAGDVTWVEELTGGTVHSSPWTTLHFGLGLAQVADEVEIHWPSGLIETRSNVTVDQRLEAVEGDWTD